MANTLRIRRRSSSGAVGAPSALKGAELAFNEKDFTLYYGYGDDGAGNATSIISIGGSGAFVDLSSAQTINGQKTFGTTPIHPTPATADNTTKSATTAFVKAQGYITGNQNITVSGDASGSGTTSIPLTLATVNANVGTFTKVTVNAKGLVTAATTLSANDIPNLTASKITDFDTQVRTNRLDQLAAPTQSVSFNGQYLTNLADPVNPQDATTKNYVDNLIQGLDPKASVQFATTAPLPAYTRSGNVLTANANGTLTIDGGNPTGRVLIKDETTQANNGIYDVTNAGGSGATFVLTRAKDFDNWLEVPGSFVFVEQGTVNADTGWLSAADTGGTINTTAISFVQFSSAGVISAGNGLTKTGNTLSVVGTANRITVSGSGVDIAATYAGQTTIVTLGTITTGTWQGTVIGLAYGGTGANLSGATDGTLFKKSGTAFVPAIAGTDYLDTNSTIDCGTF